MIGSFDSYVIASIARLVTYELSLLVIMMIHHFNVMLPIYYYLQSNRLIYRRNSLSEKSFRWKLNAYVMWHTKFVSFLFYLSKHAIELPMEEFFEIKGDARGCIDDVEDYLKQVLYDVYYDFIATLSKPFSWLMYTSEVFVGALSSDYETGDLDSKHAKYYENFFEKKYGIKGDRQGLLDSEYYNAFGYFLKPQYYLTITTISKPFSWISYGSVIGLIGVCKLVEIDCGLDDMAEAKTKDYEVWFENNLGVEGDHIGLLDMEFYIEYLL